MSDDNDRKSRDDTVDLEQIRNLISDLPQDTIDEDITFETIMAEERYNAVTAPRRAAPPSPPPEPDDPATGKLRQVAEEMRRLPRRPAEEPAPKPPEAAPVKTVSAVRPSLLDDDFEEIFKQAAEGGGVYRGHEPDDGDYEEPIRPRRQRESIPEQIRRFIHRPLPPLESTAEQAYKRVEPYYLSLRMRTILAFLLALPLAYMALAPVLKLPAPDALVYAASPYRYLLISGLLLLGVMLCAVDVVARGLSDLLHLRPGIETLVTLSGLTTLLHVITLVTPLRAYSIGYVPYTTVTGLNFFFALWASCYQYGGYRYTYRTAAQASQAVTLEQELWNGLAGYTKREGTAEGFVSRTETPDISRRISSLLAPIFMVTALLFAVVASIGQGRGMLFFWAWSALSSAAAPFAGLFVFSLPFFRVARRLHVKGGAIAGWTAARELRGGDFIVAGDNDLFPPEHVSLNGLKVFNNHSFEQVTSYAAALLRQAGSALYPAMQQVTRDKAATAAEQLEHHEAGGLSGEIRGERVLLGSAAFLTQQGIRLPKELTIKKAVYLTVSMELAGIFAVNYIAGSGLTAALRMLGKQGIIPLLAVRDFNITPTMLAERYKIDPDTLEYPTIEDRLALSDPNRDTVERPCAVVVREGLSPMAECVTGAQRLFKIARLNLWFYLICVIASMGAMIYCTYTGTGAAALAVLPGNVMVFYLLWWLPVWITGALAHRY